MQKHRFSSQLVKQLLPLHQSNNYRWIAGLLSDYAIIAVAIGLAIKVSWWFYPLSILVIGSRMRALATLMHDAAHFRLTKNRLMNKIIGGWCIAFFIFQDFKRYRESHVVNHHLFLGDKNKDPDYQYYLSTGLYEPRNVRSFIKKYILAPLLFMNSFSFIKYLILNRLYNKNYKLHSALIGCIWILLLAISYHYGILLYLLLFWLVPLVTVFPMLSWFIELSEHYPLVGQAENNLSASWNRNSFWLENFLTGAHNESYHLVHHLFPGIPYWNIKKAHAILMNDDAYRAVNHNSGGIFISSNGEPAIIFQMLSPKINPIIINGAN